MAQTGDWTIERATNVHGGDPTFTLHGLDPETTYDMRWLAMGYDYGANTPGPATIFTTTPIEVDALIRNLGDDDFLGEHIYNTDGTNQSTGQYAAIDTPAKYEVQVRNTSPGGTSETVTVRGPGSDNKWSISYFDENDNDITTAVTNGGWEIANWLDGTDSAGTACKLRTIRVEVTPNNTATEAQPKDVLVTATLDSDADVEVDAVLATTTANLPPHPVTLSVGTPVTDHEIPLTWTANEDDDFGWYELHRATQADFSDDTFVDASWDPADLSYRDTGLTPNTTYYYKLVVFDWGGLSTDSNVVSAHTGSALSAVRTDKETLCADAMDQANISVTVTDPNGEPLANQTVTFTVDTFLPGAHTPLDAAGEDSDLAASLSVATAVTDDAGVAHTSLTSSKQVDAHAIVNASYGDSYAQSTSITMEDAQGEIVVDADSLPADGLSTADVYLTLTYHDQAVGGHHINFFISRVWDHSGALVQPAADGSFPGYGSMAVAQDTTDDTGVAYATYTSGTLPGTIEFEADDTSVVADDGNGGGGYPGGGSPTPTPTPSGYPGGGYPGGGYPGGGYSSSGSPFVSGHSGARSPSRRTKKGVGGRRTLYPIISSFFVSDSQGHHTNRNNGFVSPILKELNRIWDPKADICFLKGNSYPLVMPYDLTDSVEMLTERSSITAQAAKLVRTSTFADEYVYYLWSIHVGSNYDVLGVDNNKIGDMDCFITDSPQYNAGLILAHESGHRLKLPHPVEMVNGQETAAGIKYRNRLMYPLLLGHTDLIAAEVTTARAEAQRAIADRKRMQHR